MSDNLLYDARTIATSYDLTEIKFELKRREIVRSNIKCTLYTCDDETLNMAIRLYNNPSVREEREAIVNSISALNQY